MNMEPKPKKFKKRGLRRALAESLNPAVQLPPETGLRGVLRLFLAQFRSYLTTGLLVWIPLIVTLWLAWWVIANVGFSLEALIAWVVISLNELGSKYRMLGFFSYIQYYPGLGFLLAMLIFLVTGFLAQYFFTQKLIEMGERIISRLPIISRIYVSVQQIRDTFMNRQGAVFQEVVLFEYPLRGVYAIGFVTSTEQGIVQETLEEDLIPIFMPSTPNPTTGFLMYVPEKELTPLDITVEEAMKLIISGGAYTAIGKSAIPKATEENTGHPPDGDEQN